MIQHEKTCNKKSGSVSKNDSPLKTIKRKSSARSKNKVSEEFHDNSELLGKRCSKHVDDALSEYNDCCAGSKIIKRE